MLCGGRWLQPESYLDYKQCDLLIGREQLRCNWPATLTLLTKDQYGKLVSVPSLKVRHFSLFPEIFIYLAILQTLCHFLLPTNIL